MLISTLIFVCILQFMVLALIGRPKIRNIRFWRQLRSSNESVDENHTRKNSKSDRFEKDKEGISVAVNNILKNPLTSDLKQDVDGRVSATYRMIEHLVENYFVFVGLSAALTAMSLVAVIFNFTGHVVEPLDHRDAIVSYTVFFAVFTAGLVKNRAVKRRFQKLKTKQEHLEQVHKNTIDNMKYSHKTALEEQERVHFDIVEKLEQEISGLKQQLPSEEDDETKIPRRILDVFTRNTSQKED